MSSFFTTPASQRKRKRPGTDSLTSHPSKSRQSKETVSKSDPNRPSKRSLLPSNKRQERNVDRDEDISSESDDGKTWQMGEDDEDSEEEYADETAAEKRLRLAQQYLDNIRTETEGAEFGFNAEDIDRDLIAERLKEDVAEDKGRLYRHIATSYDFTTSKPKQFRHNFGTTTAIAVCPPYIYTTTKSITLIKWQIPTSTPSSPSASTKPKLVKYIRSAQKPKTFSRTDPTKGHTSDILCIAASPSGKFLATGGADGRIVIWDPTTLKILKIFTQHRDAVNGLVFRRGTHQLYSCSSDRTIKLWSLDELTYVETLFGHQDTVVGIAALGLERCVSVGARDKTVRLWKIVDETQLVFRGGGGGRPKKGEGVEEIRYAEGSIDTVAMVDEDHFLTGSDNGSISLYSLHKKKAITTVILAHGVDPSLSPSLASAETNPDIRPSAPPGARYITALTTIPYSDTFFSGSWDGVVKVWRIVDKKRIEFIADIGMPSIPTLQPLPEAQPLVDGDAAAVEEDKEDVEMNGDDHLDAHVEDEEKKTPFRGVVNGIAVFERGTRGEEGCSVVVGIGEELRMGRWLKVKGRCGGVLFDVDKIPAATNGV